MLECHAKSGKKLSFLIRFMGINILRIIYKKVEIF